MKKSWIRAFLVCIILITVTGCKYVSSYSAIAFVRSNTSKHASMSFYQFRGMYVMELNCKNEGQKISYTGELEEGTIQVYYDNDGTKTEWFTLQAGENVQDVSPAFQKGTVYILIEASKTASHGKLEFDLE